MKKILDTQANNGAALLARLAIAITIFPHGAQKLLGWFGGAGFTNTMTFMTESVHAPWILGFMVVLVEFFGSIFLFFGLFTRIAALAIIFNFIGVLIVDIWGNGFFMNWGGAEGQGEGLEYFILLFILLLISLLYGGGKASADAFLFSKKTEQPLPS